jgi:hypothetical protein
MGIKALLIHPEMPTTPWGCSRSRPHCGRAPGGSWSTSTSPRPGVCSWGAKGEINQDLTEECLCPSSRST